MLFLLNNIILFDYYFIHPFNRLKKGPIMIDTWIQLIWIPIDVSYFSSFYRKQKLDVLYTTKIDKFPEFTA